MPEKTQSLELRHCNVEVKNKSLTISKKKKKKYNYHKFEIKSTKTTPFNWNGTKKKNYKTLNTIYSEQIKFEFAGSFVEILK